jgi:nitrite reductase/ring-hydroxylating ferredoxin subunit/uncharacterized membrane protein
MHRAIASLIDAQESWAKPLGTEVQHLLERLFEPYRWVKDLLNGTWLGHPVHPMITDVPVGAMTIAAVLDVAGQERAADVAVATGVAAMTASAVTGLADGVDAYGKPQVYATVHATLMAGSLVAYTGSLVLRMGPRALRPVAVLTSMAGYAALAAGAYVGGELVFKQGNQVSRHAFETGGTKWKALDVTEVPAGKLVKAKAGVDTIVLYREADGAAIQALHAVCAHAGGPLDKGSLVDGCVECPWHGSRFRLADGQLRRGPAVYDQPAFEVRETAEGGLEARRVVAAG